MARLDGRIAIVTGAGTGQGRSVALRLAREGAQAPVPDIAEADYDRVMDISYVTGTYIVIDGGWTAGS
jgi:NAD(P)-dependent dehydrogenase (short-subunit alcohol dehydrogenase family)